MLQIDFAVGVIKLPLTIGYVQTDAWQSRDAATDSSVFVTYCAAGLKSSRTDKHRPLEQGHLYKTV